MVRQASNQSGSVQKVAQASKLCMLKKITKALMCSLIWAFVNRIGYKSVLRHILHDATGIKLFIPERKVF